MWSAQPDAPSSRTEVAAAVAGGTVVVAGGLRADGGTVTTVELFDPRTRTWTAGPPLPLPVNHAMAAAAGGAVYIFGGYLADGSPSAAAFRLEPGPAGGSAAVSAGARWRSVTDLPAGRAAGAAAAIGDKVYLAGGIGPAKDQLAESTLVYDTRTGTWSTAPGVPTRREHLGGAAAGGLFYTVGGRTATGGNLAVVESYDPAAGAWTRRPDLPTARGGLAATASCTGQVIAAGGEGRHTFPQVEIFYPERDAWRSLPPMPHPRHGLGLVTVGTTLLSLPGGPEPGLHVASTTEALDLSFLGPCPS
ncbi:Kelch repeat-containing protein [Dactylosporangium sp. CS-033363]|uniref:Kelch repeat-containing protein n=1 Tax=Dactylosporangium sp. CS-033363 TaxID=3239935 RepID=UPI003D91780F